MHQRTPARRRNFNAPTAAGANSNTDQTIRGSASAAKHTANQTTANAATTSAGRNAPRGAAQTDQRAQLALTTISPTKLQPPRLPLAPTPKQPTPIKSTASGAVPFARQHNAPSDATHLATDRTGPQHRKCLNHFAYQSARTAAAADVNFTSRRRSKAPHVPSVTSPTKLPLPLPPLGRTTMY